MDLARVKCCGLESTLGLDNTDYKISVVVKKSCGKKEISSFEKFGNEDILVVLLIV